MTFLTRPADLIPRWPRRTIGLRLTLFYTGLFLVSGAGLLAITYVLVRFTPIAGSTHTYSAITPASHHRPGPSLARLPSQAALQAQDARQHNADLNRLLIVSGIALASMTVASVFLGWLVADRALRPMRTITAAAQEVSSTSLNRRLDFSGPDDELKELADTFDGLLGRLERSFQSQRLFVANASHELRTPLTLERALLEAILTDPDPASDAFRVTCERLLAGNIQQERLIEALLTLATSERGIDCLEPFDLAAVAEQAVASRLGEAERLGIQVETKAARAPATGDADLAERLVVNLIDNALRHNLPGGAVALATGTDAGQVVLRVTNTGPEVPADMVRELFQPFRRLGHGRVRSRGGHGLGLAIVSAIATAHHATIHAHAIPDGGLDVEVRFPATPEPLPGSQEPVSPEPSRTPAMSMRPARRTSHVAQLRRTFPRKRPSLPPGHIDSTESRCAGRWPGLLTAKTVGAVW